MAMLDSLFNKGFKASKCKTMLKLTIPRIKLLRNRREIQIRQMRRDIAKLLETGQEATARIRVEHIIREENMMAAQEILELFCELIAVRLPIIELQRECPLDLKEAISSVCFAAPRCADLPELLQVQLLFASKYGKEFVSAVTELMPDCGVNRQLIELLSIRAPSAEKKLNLLKEIAEEHKVDWDPAASETALYKSHEDLLFVSESKLPLPKEKHDETLVSTSDEAHGKQSDLDTDTDILDLPNVPMESVLGVRTPSVATAPAIVPPLPDYPELGNKVYNPENVSQELNFKAEETRQERSDLNYEEHTSNSAGIAEDKQFLPFISPPSPSFSSSLYARSSEHPTEPPRTVLRTTSEVDVDLQDVFAAATQELNFKAEETRQERSDLNYEEHESNSAGIAEDKQFLPFISPPSPSFSSSLYARSSEHPTEPPRTVLRTTSEVDVDLQDVLAAAQNAAESAERAAAAARSAASLAQIRISEITKRKNEQVPEIGYENPFHTDMPNQVDSKELPDIGEHSSSGSVMVETPRDEKITQESEDFNVTSVEQIKVMVDHNSIHHTPQRSPSMENDTYFSYPNLFTSQNSSKESGSHSPGGNSP